MILSELNQLFREFFMKPNRIVECKALEPYRVWVKFNDGFEGIVDVSEYKEVRAFKEAWSVPDGFQQVIVDPYCHTIAWGEPGRAADIDPDSLRASILNENTP